MDVESDGHSSDSSDSWCLIDNCVCQSSENEDKNCDSGVVSEYSTKDGTSSASSFPISDCYELNDLGLLVESPEDERDVILRTKLDSDIDTDGVSIISDEESGIDWKQTAHENYHNLIVADPAIRPEVNAKPELERSTHTNDLTVICDEAAEKVRSENEVTGSLAEDSYSPQNTYIFLTSFFLALAGYIAVNIISGPPSEKVAEIMEALDRLKSENDALRVQLNYISQAYLTLEAKLSKPEGTLNDDVSEREPPQSRIDSQYYQLGEFGEFRKLDMAAERLRDDIDMATDDNYNTLHSQFDPVSKSSDDAMKDGVFHDMKDIYSITEDTPVRSCVKADDVSNLNIVQWFPEEDIQDCNVGDSNTIIEPSKIRIEELNKEDTSDYLENPKQRQSNREKLDKSKNKNYKKQSRNSYEKISKSAKPKKDRSKEKKKQDKHYMKNAADVKYFNHTSKWFHERNKGRDSVRKEQRRSDWQFDRAQNRRDQRHAGERKSGHWYFRSFSSRSLHRKPSYASDDMFFM